MNNTINFRELENIKTQGQLIPFIKHMIENFNKVSETSRSGLSVTYIDNDHGLYQLYVSALDTSFSYTERRLADSDSEHKYRVGRTFTSSYLTRHGSNKLFTFLHERGFYL